MPKFIIRNKQLFEVIFTFLQTHPCYLQNLICNTSIFEESGEIRMILEAVFGQKTILDNTRVLRTLMVLGGRVLAEEVKTQSMKEITSLYKTDS